MNKYICFFILLIASTVNSCEKEEDIFDPEKYYSVTDIWHYCDCVAETENHHPCNEKILKIKGYIFSRFDSIYGIKDIKNNNDIALIFEPSELKNNFINQIAGINLKTHEAYIIVHARELIYESGSGKNLHVQFFICDNIENIYFIENKKQ